MHDAGGCGAFRRRGPCRRAVLAVLTLAWSARLFGRTVQYKPRSAEIDYALSNSFGFGGHNVSLILGRASTRRQRSA